MTLTLIAEVLAGETRMTPSGPVDTDTACGLDAFTWDQWLARLHAAEPDMVEAELLELEVNGAAVTTASALAR